MDILDNILDVRLRATVRNFKGIKARITHGRATTHGRAITHGRATARNFKCAIIVALVQSRWRDALQCYRIGPVRKRESEREMDGWIESRGVVRGKEGMIMCAKVKESESE